MVEVTDDFHFYLLFGVAQSTAKMLPFKLNAQLSLVTKNALGQSRTRLARTAEKLRNFCVITMHRCTV